MVKKKINFDFEIDNKHFDSFKFKIYTYFGIKLVEYIYNYKNINNEMNNIFLKNFNNIKIPINNIKFWILGLPGNNNKYKLNNNGYLKKIEYKNNNNFYKIFYKKYNNNFYPSIPRVIIIKFNKNKLVLIIKKYSFVNENK